MAEAVIGTTIEVLLNKLIAVSEEEIRLIKNFKKDLQKLKDSATMIRKFLEDAEKKVVTEESARCWLRKLEVVAFDADYVIDEVNYHFLRKKVQRGSKIKKKVRCFFPNCKSFSFRHKMARKIKDIEGDLKTINEEAKDLHLVQKIESVSARGAGIAEYNGDAELSRETDSLSQDRVLVGRENDAMKIVEMVKNSSSENKVSIIPIVGMGGLGKTTLARKIFHDDSIVSLFENRIWAYVSERFVPETVFKSVFLSLTRKIVDGNREVVLRELREEIGDKRYFLVLDDVWNEDRAKWDNFITSLEAISPPKGNVVLVTTRSGNVASTMKTSYIHELGSLSKEECWSIIKDKAFGDDSVPKEFENIGESITKKCGGLPLAAKVVGGLLRGKSEDEWRSIEKEGFGEDVKDISEILRLSFNNLPSPSIKKCFAYCSILPKGWSMQRDEMIHLWMAEGFLQADEKNDMEIVGNKVFNSLLRSSLVQVKKREWYEKAERFGMHDLVHDLASSILNPKFLDGSHPVRYISKAFSDESSSIPEEQARCLRALLFSGKISDITLSNLTRLHVLIVKDDEMKELPVEICKLICLRLLDISNTKMEHLPDSIGELYHLQTLRATKEHGGEGSLKKLPQTIKFLTNLRHLYIPRIELPRDVGKLSNLRSLPCFQVGNEEGCGIIELGSLNNLKGTIQIHNLEKVRNKVDAENANLLHKPNILKLKLEWNETRENDQNSDEDVLEGLQPHFNLESLEIVGFKGNNFPSWTLRMEGRDDVADRWIKLDNLLEIKLSICKECEEIPMMGQLRRLKSLYLCYLPNVKSIGSSFYGIKEDDVNKRTKIDVFPALEHLELREMENLSTWAQFEWSCEVSVFCRLKHLSIRYCPQLESAPSHFPNLKELKINGVESGKPLESICGSKLTTLTELTISYVNGLVCLPNGLFDSNRDLSELIIQNCSNLTHLVPCLGGGGASLGKLIISKCSLFEKLPMDLYKLNALEELKMWDCPNLKSIEYPSERQLSSLRYLQFMECSGLTNLPCILLESCAPTLEQMDLYGSVSLVNLPQVMSCLHEMRNLKTLEIAGVPGLEDAVVKNGSLGNIEVLRIGGCGDYVSVGRILPAFPSLRGLYLIGMEDWDALPEQLQHLTTLQLLSIQTFGIQVLPEWFEKLSLRILLISDCKKLGHLGSKKVMQCLTRLEHLHIYGSSLLKQNLDVSERSMLSRIPKIYVEGVNFRSNIDG